MSKTKILPADAFDHIVRNAGVLLKTFSPSTKTISADSIIGATSGGISVTDGVEYRDDAEDIDNAVLNTKEFKEVDSRTITVSGTYKAVSAETIKGLVACADYDAEAGTITPRDTLKAEDFLSEMWLVTDYGNDKMLAIQFKNLLNTGGYNLQTQNNGKGDHSFTYTAHYSASNQSEVPYKIYLI